MNLNVVTLTGRLTADSELKETQTGTQICNFRLAVNDRRKEDKTMFLNVVVFGRQAEVLAEHLTKGKLIGVTGRLDIDTYEKDGVKRDSVSVIANDIQLGPKNAAPAE